MNADSTTDRRRPRRRPAAVIVELPVLLPALATVAVFGCVEAIVRGGLVTPHTFPAPTQVVGALWGQLGSGGYWTAVWKTLQGWGLGLGLAIVAAVPAGLVVGTNKYLFRSVRFVVEFVRPIPSIALLPLFILIFGFTLSLKVYIAALGAFFPLFFQTLYGVQDVDPVTRDTARAYRVGRVRRFLLVELPGATPLIATGLRISATIALVACVASELIVGVPGLGASVAHAQNAGRIPLMYAYIATSGVLGLILAWVFTQIEKRLLRWHVSQRSEAPA
jgi:ABC-type nitrate/sulfonate/bicarbonate transport system permease component